MFRSRSSFLVVLLLIISFAVTYKFIEYRAYFPKTNSTPSVDFQELTDGWKIYSNDVYNISFKFPSGFDFIEISSESTVFFTEGVDEKEKLQECLRLSPTQNCISSLQMIFRNYAKPKEKDTPIDNIVRDGLSVTLENDYYSSIEVGGIRGIYKQQKTPTDPEYLFLDTGRDNILEIQLILKNNNRIKDVLQKMIGTMNFL